jgi:hypothetical protein
LVVANQLLLGNIIAVIHRSHPPNVSIRKYKDTANAVSGEYTLVGVGLFITDSNLA